MTQYRKAHGMRIFLPICLGYLIAGPLADRVFEPLMATDGLLVKSVGQIIGVGPRQGIGLIVMIMGASRALTTVIAYVYSLLRRVVEGLPPASDELR